MESMVAAARQIEVQALKLFLNFALRHGLSEVEAATCILWDGGDLRRQMGIFDTMVLEEIENYVQQQHLKMFFELQGLVCEFPHRVPLVNSVVTDVLLSSLQENGANGFIQGPCYGCRQELYMDRRHLTRAGHGLFSSNISPRGHDTMLEHTPATGDGEAEGFPIFLGMGGTGSSQIPYYWSPKAHEAVRAACAGPHTFIDIPAHLHFLGEKPRETADSENARASTILETMIGTLLPAAAVNARDFFGAAPDIVKLAGNLMPPALLGLCFIGMLHKRSAGRVLRLATCAGIAATTLGVSSQLSGGIYIFIAAVVGVALSFITLTA